MNKHQMKQVIPLTASAAHRIDLESDCAVISITTDDMLPKKSTFNYICDLAAISKRISIKIINNVKIQ